MMRNYSALEERGGRKETRDLLSDHSVAIGEGASRAFSYDNRLRLFGN